MKFQAPSYYKVMRELEKAQKTTREMVIPSSKCSDLQVAKNGRAGGAVMIWRVDEQGKLQHLQKPLLYLSNTGKAAAKRGEKCVLCVQSDRNAEFTELDIFSG